MRNFLNKYGYIFMILAILDLLAIRLITMKSDYEVTTPGGLNEVANLIEVESGMMYEGSFNTIYVQSFDDASLLHALVASFSEANELTEIIESKDYFDYTILENYQAGTIQKNQSIDAAIICAYNTMIEKGHSVNLDYEFIGFIVYGYMKNQEILKIGDLLVGVTLNNGEYYDITNPSMLTDCLNNLSLGDTIHYVRNDVIDTYQITEEISTIKMNRFYGYAKYEINEETIFPKYKLYHANTLGPSGGLLQTLSVYSQLSGIDLTGGKKIAGTGTISVNGKVGAIGGIKQKIITAIRSGVDIFVCPKIHKEEALEAYYDEVNHQSMHIIFVETFKEAVDELETLIEYEFKENV